MGTVEVLIRKIDGTEQEAEAIKAKLVTLALTLPGEWSLSVRYIEYRVVEK